MLPKVLKISVVVCLMTAGAVSASTKKVALIIGNSEYESTTSLRNPANDAKAMAEKLRGLGFETFEGYDLDKDEMDDTLDEFSGEVIGSELALFFYAGHGISVDGVNYIVPTDATMNNPVRWKRGMVPMEEVMEILNLSNGPNLLFMDACRDNPLANDLNDQMANASRSVNLGRGLSRIEPRDSDTAIAFATSPGTVAQDGAGSHSPFTSALLNHIGAANTSIADVMTRVTGEVKETTSGQQKPWINMSLSEPLMLNPIAVVARVEEPSQAPALEAPVQSSQVTSPDLDTQKFMFKMARDSNRISDYRAYLENFPNGMFAGMARNSIADLEKEAVAEKAPEQAPATNNQLASVQSNIIQPFPQQIANNTRAFGAALTLPLTPVVLAAPTNQITEQTLSLNKEARRNIQNRLNAMGIKVGTADGSIGPKSRRGIQQWQSQTGLVPTGYLNTLQHQMLIVASEPVLATYLASRPVAKAPSRSSSSSSSKRRGNGKKVGNAVDNFFHGLGTGIGLRVGR
ncbi:MAG: caspase family protein [Hyphomicrobiales bacterium]